MKLSNILLGIFCGLIGNVLGIWLFPKTMESFPCKACNSSGMVTPFRGRLTGYDAEQSMYMAQGICYACKGMGVIHDN